MLTYQDLIRYARGPTPEKPLPAIWDFFPCHAAAVGGVPNFLDYYFSVETKLRLQQKLQSSLPEALILPGVFPDLGVVVEASAFGGQALWFENGAPFIGPTLREPADVDHLRVPPAGLAGLMPLALTQREMMRRTLLASGREMEQFAFSMGPAEIAALLIGYDKYYLMLYDDPNRMKRLMEIATETVLGWLAKQAQCYGGVTVLVIGEHVFHQMRPDQTREFLLPYLQAIFGAFPHAIRIYHNEGRHAEEHIATVLELGADIWHFGSDVHPLETLYPRIGDRIILFGGLNPHGVMRHGTPEDVRAETRAVLGTARGRKLILSTGTGTTPETTLENQRAMVQATITDWRSPLASPPMSKAGNGLGFV